MNDTNRIERGSLGALVRAIVRVAITIALALAVTGCCYYLVVVGKDGNRIVQYGFGGAVRQTLHAAIGRPSTFDTADIFTFYTSDSAFDRSLAKRAFAGAKSGLKPQHAYVPEAGGR